MTRLDENRACAQLAARAGVHHTQITKMTIWGNHSATQFPDFENARIGGKPGDAAISDRAWLEGEFIKTVQQRGAAIIKARGLSSALSAANGLVDHVRDLINPTPADQWHSVAIMSDGSYDVPAGLISSFPVRVDAKGQLGIVQGLKLSDFAREKIAASVAELEHERSVISELLTA
jgi:malate dehydrogenase